MRLSCLPSGLLLSVLLAQAAHAAGLYTETFATNTAGWQDRDTNGAMFVFYSPDLGNPGGCIQGTFTNFFPVPPEADAFVATGDLATVSFLGDYDTAGATFMGFDLEATPYAPSEISVTLVTAVDTDTVFVTRTWRPTNLVETFVAAIAAPSVTNVYVGGQFELPVATGRATHIARWDGNGWNAVGSGFGDRVNALALDGSGVLYAGGTFTNAGDSNVNHVARWDGSAWTALGSGVGNSVTAIVVDTSGNVYVAGDITNAGDVAVQRVAKWDGAAWSAVGMNPGLEGRVNTLAVSPGGTLHAGGGFTNAGSVTLNYVARWDGSNWTNMGIGLTGQVNALTFEPAGALYAGGITPNRVARWTGSSWTNSPVNLGGSVHAITASSTNNIFVAGDFASASRFRVVRSTNNLTSWVTLSTGLNGEGRALALVNGTNLFAAGEFYKAGGSNANRIARWNGTNWFPMGKGIHRWSSLGVSLLSAGADDWTFTTTSFPDIVTNVSAVEIGISRRFENEQIYRIDNIFLGRLPRAAAVDAANGSLAWQELRTNWTYRLETATQMVDPAWAPVTRFAATNGTMSVTDTNDVPASGGRFYRLITE